MNTAVLNKTINSLQQYMVVKYEKALNDKNFSETTYKSYIQKYIREKQLNIEDMTEAQMIQYFYNELRAYSVITPYLNDPNVEEININSWEDIKIHYTDGSIVRAKHSFLSPQHAKEIINKMLRTQNFGNLLDAETPIVRGHLGSNKRITASTNPILDADCGVQGNIRIINPRKLEKKDFIEKGTATEEIYDFLLGCFQCGLSTVFIGATNAGKTTMMSSLLRLLPANKRLITIENEVREFVLHERDEEGKILNSVIHWVTNKKYDQEKLLEYSLTSNPDFICLAEMKSGEAFSVTEACRTGHSVCTTIHANSCRAAYTRMTTLCQLKGLDINYDILYRLCVESFPIAVMIKKLDDNSRKIVEITESYLDENQKAVTQTLYRYETTSREEDELTGKVKLKGRFVKVNDISDQLKQQFKEMGYNTDFLNPKPEKAPEKIKELPKKTVAVKAKPNTERRERKVEGI